MPTYKDFRDNFFTHHERASTPYMTENQLGELRFDSTSSETPAREIERIISSMMCHGLRGDLMKIDNLFLLLIKIEDHRRRRGLVDPRPLHHLTRIVQHSSSTHGTRTVYSGRLERGFITRGLHTICSALAHTPPPPLHPPIKSELQLDDERGERPTTTTVLSDVDATRRWWRRFVTGEPRRREEEGKKVYKKMQVNRKTPELQREKGRERLTRAKNPALKRFTIKSLKLNSNHIDFNANLYNRITRIHPIYESSTTIFFGQNQICFLTSIIKLMMRRCDPLAVRSHRHPQNPYMYEREAGGGLGEVAQKKGRFIKSIVASHYRARERANRLHSSSDAVSTLQRAQTSKTQLSEMSKCTREPVHAESESLAQKNESCRRRCSRDFHYHIDTRTREERFRCARTLYILHARSRSGEARLVSENACMYTRACNCFLVVGLRRKYIIITPIIVLTITTRSVKVILVYRCGVVHTQSSLVTQFALVDASRAIYDFNEDDFFTDLYRQKKKIDTVQNLRLASIGIIEIIIIKSTQASSCEAAAANDDEPGQEGDHRQRQEEATALARTPMKMLQSLSTLANKISPGSPTTDGNANKVHLHNNNNNNNNNNDGGGVGNKNISHHPHPYSKKAVVGLQSAVVHSSQSNGSNGDQKENTRGELLKIALLHRVVTFVKDKLFARVADLCM
ncbi:unnamed protein product [Trichogramma brassicae]|uniref:Uncharacterized protein n=1 Tax=Trichogramma brassicae TaxID=86971 RepID=A0A6H5IGB7_9HYME|nr:unnamed protein product [Trichogramma brassicae]